MKRRWEDQRLLKWDVQASNRVLTKAIGAGKPALAGPSALWAGSRHPGPGLTCTEEFLVNAAILMLGSAWMAGQTPDVIIPVSHTTSCGTRCSSCCDSGPRLLDRIRGLFQRDDCHDACAQPRCREVRCHEVRCHDACRQPRCHSFQWPQLNLGNRCRSSCDTCGHRAHAASCDRCGHGDLFARIRSAFRRDRGCNAGCHTRCCTSGGAVAPAAEPIKEQPKKMPGTGPKKAQETRIIAPPAQVPAIQNAPAIAPTLSPRIIGNDTRNPF